MAENEFRGATKRPLPVIRALYTPLRQFSI